MYYLIRYSNVKITSPSCKYSNSVVRLFSTGNVFLLHVELCCLKVYYYIDNIVRGFAILRLANEIGILKKYVHFRNWIMKLVTEKDLMPSTSTWLRHKKIGCHFYGGGAGYYTKIISSPYGLCRNFFLHAQFGLKVLQ